MHAHGIVPVMLATTRPLIHDTRRKRKRGREGDCIGLLVPSWCAVCVRSRSLHHLSTRLARSLADRLRFTLPVSRAHTPSLSASSGRILSVSLRSAPCSMSVRPDYIFHRAPFASSAITDRLEYERAFLAHQRSVRAAHNPALQNWNDEVFAPGGLREQLARNQKVNPLRTAREEEVEHCNRLLVRRLREIGSASAVSATTRDIRDANARVIRRVAQGKSLNDHVRAQERDRIIQENLSIAARLLTNRSELEAARFKEHQRTHEYRLANHSNIRAIKMKTSKPGATLAVHEHKSAASRKSRSAQGTRRGAQQDPTQPPQQPSHGSTMTTAEHQAAFAAFLAAQQQQQQSMGATAGLPPFLPPIAPASARYAGPSDAALLRSQEEPWLEAHESDPNSLSARAHAPKTRQSHAPHPREALHVPLPPGARPHYHHRLDGGGSEASPGRIRGEQMQQAFAALESQLVVPRTRLDPNTGTYSLEWVELHNARADEQHLARPRPQDHSREAAAAWSAEQEQQTQRDAIAQYEDQQRAAMMYEAYLAHAAAAQHDGHESKEDSPPPPPPPPPPMFWSHPPPPSLLSHTKPPPPPPQFNADGSPRIEAPWPLGGSILPPHLMPPSSGPGPAQFGTTGLGGSGAEAGGPPNSARSVQSDHRRRKLVAKQAAQHATTKRSRRGEMIFPLRKHAHDSPAPRSPSKGTSSVSPRARRDAPAVQPAMQATASAPQQTGEPQQWQSFAQQQEQEQEALQFFSAGSDNGGEDNDEEKEETVAAPAKHPPQSASDDSPPSPSSSSDPAVRTQATEVPTIASALAPAPAPAPAALSPFAEAVAESAPAANPAAAERAPQSASQPEPEPSVPASVPLSVAPADASASASNRAPASPAHAENPAASTPVAAVSASAAPEQEPVGDVVLPITPAAKEVASPAAVATTEAESKSSSSSPSTDPAPTEAAAAAAASPAAADPATAQPTPASKHASESSASASSAASPPVTVAVPAVSRASASAPASAPAAPAAVVSPAAASAPTSVSPVDAVSPSKTHVHQLIDTFEAKSHPSPSPPAVSVSAANGTLSKSPSVAAGVAAPAPGSAPVHAASTAAATAVPASAAALAAKEVAAVRQSSSDLPLLDDDLGSMDALDAQLDDDVKPAAVAASAPSVIAPAHAHAPAAADAAPAAAAADAPAVPASPSAAAADGEPKEKKKKKSHKSDKKRHKKSKDKSASLSLDATDAAAAAAPSKPVAVPPDNLNFELEDE